MYCSVTFSQFVPGEFVISHFLSSLQFFHLMDIPDASVSKCFFSLSQFEDAADESGFGRREGRGGELPPPLLPTSNPPKKRTWGGGEEREANPNHKTSYQFGGRVTPLPSSLPPPHHKLVWVWRVAPLTSPPLDRPSPDPLRRTAQNFALFFHSLTRSQPCCTQSVSCR